MIDTIPQADATLTQFLAARARHTSDDRLVADVIGGVLGAAAILFWRIPGWPILLGIAACFAAFGIWGIADRELGERAGQSRRVLLSFEAVRALAAVVGFSAATFAVLVLLAKALGRMIS